jgi:ABC-type sugar transport system permease subunit
MAVIIWKELGFAAVLFLARLSSVSPDLYDAARVDGAGWLRLLRHISLPAVRPQIEFYVTLMVATLLSWVFAYVFVISFGGPGRSTVVTEFYIYLNAFRYSSLGVAAAASVILLALAGVFIVATARLRSGIAAELES